MATVINNPPNEGSGAGAILGVVVVIAVIALVLVYALPRLRGGTTAANPAPSASVNVTLPSAGDNGGSQPTGQ